MLAACAHNPPELATVPADTTPAPAPIATSLTPSAASGTWRVNATMESTRRSGARRSQGSLQLSATPAAAALPGGSATQFNATVALSGYTVAPRGRAGQAGAWWPIGGDSVAVEFISGSGQIQLRGALTGRTIRGEVWFLSGATGATFQMGTFTASKSR